MTTQELWTWADLVAASGGRADGSPTQPITGFTFDTRALEAGNVFVALKDQRDGHDFVPSAFKSGAAAAIVSTSYDRKPGDGALLRVASPLAALENIGMAARARLAPDARVIAVTGSAGKTTTKEMLRACLTKVAPGRVHASEKSYNNHWGVPLTLARMPADTRYGVFEIGMNHAGEITPLSRMVRPHVALVTTVEAVHLEHFPNEEAIADAKGEIFAGLESDGVAIIKRSNHHAARLVAHATKSGARPVLFALPPDASNSADGNTKFVAKLADGRELAAMLAMPGHHNAENAVAVIAALDAVGADVAQAALALATMQSPQGRGARSRLPVAGGDLLLIDESYNANPASMRAALATVATVERTAFPRRVAVLGDMLELGPLGAALHRDLFDAVDEAGIDVLFACGPLMKGLYDAAPSAMKGGWAETSAALSPQVLEALAAGDVVMVKASNGTRLGPLVEAIKARFVKGAAAQ